MKGSCDPSPEPFNIIEYADNNGLVVITVRWSWDGVSVYPDCDGPIQDITAVNNGTVPWTIQAPSLRNGKTGRTFSLNPGQTVTVSGNKLSQAGLSLASDVGEIFAHRS